MVSNLLLSEDLKFRIKNLISWNRLVSNQLRQQLFTLQRTKTYPQTTFWDLRPKDKTLKSQQGKKSKRQKDEKLKRQIPKTEFNDVRLSG